MCGPLGACQTRHPWNHRATRKAVWGGVSRNVLILSIARCHHAHTHGRQWGSRGGEGKVDSFMWVNCRSCQMAHRPGAGPEQSCRRRVCFHCCHSLHFIIFSIPAPSHPQIHTHTHTHTSYPDTCPVMCPTLRLEARLPDPQGSRDLSLILLPDLWLSISHQPPSAPQSICPTLADLTSSSLTFTSLNSTLYYHVPSPDVPPNEKAVSMRLETLSDPLCSSRRALQCWDHTRCFMNIQECAGLFTSSLHLLYG